MGMTQEERDRKLASGIASYVSAMWLIGVVCIEIGFAIMFGVAGIFLV